MVRLGYVSDGLSGLEEIRTEGGGFWTVLTILWVAGTLAYGM